VPVRKECGVESFCSTPFLIKAPLCGDQRLLEERTKVNKLVFV